MRDLRLPVTAFIALLIAGLMAFPALAQTAEQLPPICVEVDQWLDQHVAEIDKRQQLYQQEHRTYWQGLSTHADELSYDELSTKEEIAKEPDNFQAKPTDQSEGWSDFFPEWSVEKLPATIRIDVYDGPEGPGYTVNVSLLYKDVLFVRVLQFGPESWRESAWHSEVTQP